MSTFFNNLGSAVSKMLHMNNNEFEDEYDVNDDTLDEDEIEEDEIIEEEETEESGDTSRYESRSNQRSGGRLAQIKDVTPNRGVMSVVLVKPTEVNEAAEISAKLKNGKTILLNLENLDNYIAQRILDFVYGACYNMDGKINYISSSIFIVTPPNVDLTDGFAQVLNAAQSLDSTVPNITSNFSSSFSSSYSSGYSSGYSSVPRY